MDKSFIIHHHSLMLPKQEPPKEKEKAESNSKDYESVRKRVLSNDRKLKKAKYISYSYVYDGRRNTNSLEDTLVDGLSFKLAK